MTRLPMFMTLAGFLGGVSVGTAISDEPILTLMSVGMLGALWAGAIAFKLDRREEKR